MTTGFRRRELVMATGAVWCYDPVVWRDAVVLVESGEVELETVDGARGRFDRGAVLCFAGLQLHVLRNVGPGEVVLIAVSSRTTDSFPSAEPSHKYEHQS